MKVLEIAKILEGYAPKKYASSWDNVGLMIGSLNDEVRKVMITLDVTPEVVKECIASGSNMIISHHPLFFSEFKNIDFDSTEGRMIKDLISNNICVYSCHTNLDAAENGINSLLAEMFELINVSPLEENEYSFEVGIGRIGEVKNPITFGELCDETKRKLQTPALRVICDDFKKTVSKICVASGSCGDLIELAKNKGADVIITADVKYHQALLAKALGISVIDAGHFPTEYVVLKLFREFLQNTQLEIVSANIKDVFEFI